MTLIELWEKLVFVGEIEIYDDQGLKVIVKSLADIVLDINNPHHELQNREIEYITTHPANNKQLHKLVIKLKKGKEN